MTADHVLAAMKEIEMEMLVPELESQLANFRKIMKEKKDRKSVTDLSGNAEKVTEEDLDDDIEIIGD